jgi:hypothetical protein
MRPPLLWAEMCGSIDPGGRPLLNRVRFAVREAFIDDRPHLTVGFASKSSLFGSESALLRTKAPHLLTQSALLRTKLTHACADLTLHRAELSLQVTQFLLQIGEFLPADGLALFRL